MPYRLVVALVCFGTGAFADAEYLGSYTWSEPEEHFGGFSGIEMSDDGTRMIAITDRSWIVEADVIRDGILISGVANPKFDTIKGPNGQQMPKFWDDSEGLARDTDGTLYISFEANHRVARFKEVGGPSEVMPQDPDFKGMQNNSSLEALAVDANGTLYTLPERSGALDLPFPVYRFSDGVWTQPFRLRRDPPFLPTGADVGPDGKFYLLERHFNGIGFQTQVRRFSITGEDEETLITTGSMEHDNLEGISVWRDSDGFIRLTMISDDNFRFFQRTEIVEYRLTE